MTNFEQPANNPEILTLSIGSAELERDGRNTEDTVLIGDGYAAVFDGMGGGDGNPAAAAQAAAEGVNRAFASARPPHTRQDLLRSMEAGFEAARRYVAEYGEGGDTVGTAIRFATINGKLQCGIAHAGDTRLYLYRNGMYKQVTDDQCHPIEKNQVTNGLGRSSHSDVEDVYGAFTIHHGDRLMLCSDGITGDWDASNTHNYPDQTFSEAEMLQAFAQPTAQSSADTFLMLSMPKKHDDKSVIVIDVVDPSISYPSASSFYDGNIRLSEAREFSPLQKLTAIIALGATAYLLLDTCSGSDESETGKTPISCESGIVKEGGSAIQAFSDAFEKFDNSTNIPSYKEIQRFGQKYEAAMQTGKFVQPGARVTICEKDDGSFGIKTTKK